MLLNKNIKSRNLNSLYHFLIGLFFAGMTVWVILDADKKPKGIDQFDWVYIFAFGLVSVWFLIKGISALLSKAFMVVNEEKISVKPDESSQRETIFWKDVSHIEDVNNNYRIYMRNGTSTTIYFSYYSSENSMELKESIKSMAEKKRIKVQKIAGTKYVLKE